MCVLFVVGVMNLIWVAVLSVFVLVKRLDLPASTVARVAGVIMIVSRSWCSPAFDSLRRTWPDSAPDGPWS